VIFSKQERAMNIDHPTATLSAEELDHVSGGMKWDHNYVSKNVIDARGGQFTIGWTFTVDVNGHVSSVSPP
jgi:hypothetical protein